MKCKKNLIKVSISKSVVIILFHIIIAKVAVCQHDSAKLERTLHLYVQMESHDGIIDIEESLSYDITKHIRHLEFSGFDNFEFLIFSNDLLHPDSSNLHPIGTEKKFYFEYIIGYDTKQDRLFRLKGFNRIDFEEFYIYNISNFDKRQNKTKGRLIDSSVLNDEYYIEGVDLKCLYEHFILKKRNKP